MAHNSPKQEKTTLIFTNLNMDEREYVHGLFLLTSLWTPNMWGFFPLWRVLQLSIHQLAVLQFNSDTTYPELMSESTGLQAQKFHNDCSHCKSQFQVLDSEVTALLFSLGSNQGFPGSHLRFDKLLVRFTEHRKTAYLLPLPVY